MLTIIDLLCDTEIINGLAGQYSADFKHVAGGQQEQVAFVTGSFGNFIYIFRGYDQGMYDLVFIAVVMTILNLRAWLKWRGENPY